MNLSNKAFKIFLSVLMIFASFFKNGYSQSSTVALSFQNGVLNSGTALKVGAIYKFDNVTTGINAFVKVDSLVGGATLIAIDTVGTDYAAALQPRVKSLPGGNSYAVFKITFKSSGVLTSISNLTATALDIDGTTTLKEFAQIDLGGGHYNQYSDSSHINITPEGTGFRGTNIKGLEVTGIDTTRYDVMFDVEHTNVATVYIKFGSNIASTSGANTRNFSVYFNRVKPPASYTNRTLPLHLVSLKTTLINNTPLLTWVTEDEKETSHFSVERSEDLKLFKEVGIVMSFTHTTTKTTYTFKDNSALKGRKYYYRLKCVDGNGKYIYSPVSAVVLSADLNKSIYISASPNPVKDIMKLSFPSSWQNEKVSISFFTPSGRLFKQLSVASLHLNETINVSDLPAGYYLVQAKTKAEQKQIIIIKE